MSPAPHWKLVEGSWLRIDGVCVTPTSHGGELVWLVQFPWAWIDDRTFPAMAALAVQQDIDHRFPLPAWLLPAGLKTAPSSTLWGSSS